MGWEDGAIWLLHDEIVTELAGHSNRVEALIALPNGRLASAGWDNSIRLWDLATNEEICGLEADAPIFSLVAFSDGRFVAGDAIGRLLWLEIVG